mmetsp:Transcript_95016/g.273512  ORF Transcript_95016/g.273512 Transcript_95016/m.273512 type:complete len:164 (-) Transcript_95016:87-578(-)
MRGSCMIQLLCLLWAASWKISSAASTAVGHALRLRSSGMPTVVTPVRQDHAVLAVAAAGHHRSGACAVEMHTSGEPAASRGEACSQCAEFRDGHRSSKWVLPNSPLCPRCWSVKSSCSEGSFAWSCYDENDVFKSFAKNSGSSDLDEPSEMHESFKDKEPQVC